MLKKTWPYILAFVWGGVWASFLQWNRLGKYLVHQRTWLTVVVGVGMDLLLMRWVMPFQVWLRACGIVALSSQLIIFRSLLLETNQHEEVMNGIANTVGKQNNLGVGGFDSYQQPDVPGGNEGDGSGETQPKRGPFNPSGRACYLHQHNGPHY